MPTTALLSKHEKYSDLSLITQLMTCNPDKLNVDLAAPRSIIRKGFSIEKTNFSKVFFLKVSGNSGPMGRGQER